MVFNWFRRQFDDKSQETPPQESEPTPVTPETPSAKSTESEISSDSTEDYLNWAKAAYKNLQKHKEEPSTSETVMEETLTPTPREEAIVEESQPLITETVAETPRAEIVAEIPQPVIPETVEISAPLPLLEEKAEEISTPVTTTEVSPEENTIASPLPFWAQRETDRLARIEQLKETAIIEEEKIITSASDNDIFDPIPDFILDEGFLWSAEILASQGRRPDQVSFEEITWLQKLRKGLERTRRSLINRLRAIVGQGPLNQDAIAEIETLLLQADVGVQATDFVINSLQEKLREEVLPPDKAIAYLKQILREVLEAPTQEVSQGSPLYSLTFAPEKDQLNIWLMVGVNGAGKTTTIGKLAHIAQKSGYRTLIAAADTFRAAAVEQVKVWGQRSDVEVIANPGKNTDPAAVVFDAISAAQARNSELLIIDTAGRLQNKKNLMDELSKVRRIIDKKAPDAMVESLLVLDSTLGQNGLRQAEVFAQAAKLSGVVLTKLDGTAKGGVALAVVKQLGLPIRFIGVGESIEDLRPFSSYEFVEALLSS